MLVSLKVLPVALEPDRMQLNFAVDEATATWSGSYESLFSAMTSGRPLTVMLSTPEPKMPSQARIKKASMKQEARVAEALGGKRQRGSGAVAWRKGDGRVRGKYLLENKTCLTKGFRVERAALAKIRSECSPGEEPLFQIDFTNPSTLRVEDAWVLVPLNHWEKVCGALSNDRRPDAP